MIYLDHAATTPVLPAVSDAVVSAMAQTWGNPSSLHPAGQQAGRLLRESRRRVAEALGATAPEILFAASGSEANQWALCGALLAARTGEPFRQLVTSELEHPSVHNAVSSLGEDPRFPGLTLLRLPVTSEGRIELDDLPALLDRGPTLLSLMWVNNETGIRQPVEEAVAMARSSRHPAVVHVDGVQALGHLPVDLGTLRADFVTLSGHKVGAPKGAAVLYRRQRGEKIPKFSRLIEGGGQEFGLRGGTENTAFAAALAVAVPRAQQFIQEHPEHYLQLGRHGVAAMTALPGVTLNAPLNLGTGAILSFAVAGVESDVLQIRLGGEGICVSGGSACASGSRRPSRVLTAMGLAPEVVGSSLRLSFGPETTLEEIDACAGILGRLLPELRGG